MQPLLQSMQHFSFTNVIYHLTSIASLPPLSPVSKSSLKHPHSVLPKPLHHTQATCGMVIHEQT